MDHAALLLLALVGLGAFGYVAVTEQPHAEIESFSMPRLIADRGWTEAVVVDRLDQHFVELAGKASTSLAPVGLRVSLEVSLIDKVFEALNLAPLSRLARRAIGQHVYVLTGTGFLEDDTITLRLAVTSADRPPQRIAVEGPVEELDDLLRVLAKDAFYVINPYLGLMVDYGAGLAAGGGLPARLLATTRQAAASAPAAHQPFYGNLTGLLLAQGGKTEEAIETFRMVAESAPDFCAARVNAAELLLRAKRGQEAWTVLEDCERRASLPQVRAVAWSMRSAILGDRGEVVAARAAIAAGEAARPGLAELRVRLVGLAAEVCDEVAFAEARRRALAAAAPGLPGELLAAAAYRRGGVPARLAELGLEGERPACGAAPAALDRRGAGH